MFPFFMSYDPVHALPDNMSILCICSSVAFHIIMITVGVIVVVCICIHDLLRCLRDRDRFGRLLRQTWTACAASFQHRSGVKSVIV